MALTELVLYTWKGGKKVFKEQELFGEIPVEDLRPISARAVGYPEVIPYDPNQQSKDEVSKLYAELVSGRELDPIANAYMVRRSKKNPTQTGVQFYEI